MGINNIINYWSSSNDYKKWNNKSKEIISGGYKHWKFNWDI